MISQVVLTGRETIAGKHAFGQCIGLEELLIGEGAFAGCPNLTVIFPKGSRAEAYCMEKGILYEGE
ncbi:MAG: leucine-rich repeat domain-containing protein [Lachnospiraceae bacterium]|mgnify:CR=1 FL=1